MRGLLLRSRAWLGARPIHRETVQEYFARHANDPGHRYETVHPPAVVHNPLPCNLASRDDLPDDRGWWGFSFRDVPARTSGETFEATLPDCRVVWYRDPALREDFFPAIVTADHTALDYRELRFRDPHAEVLKRSPLRLKRATWIIERVYHNHSHWLTAHMPKLLWLRQRNRLEHVMLPAERTPPMDASMRLAGLEPEGFASFGTDRPLQVDELTILGTDRFRPELLQLLPPAYRVGTGEVASRRVFISRAHAVRRRLVNEDDVWARLGPAGFERVCMEDLHFEAQVELMRRTAVLVAPHGAGLTNMIFCPPRTHVIEIADLAFPNPNFYALAAALRHRYWLVAAEALGDCHPLEKDLRVDPAAVGAVLMKLGES